MVRIKAVVTMVEPLYKSALRDCIYKHRCFFQAIISLYVSDFEVHPHNEFLNQSINRTELQEMDVCRMLYFSRF